MVRHGEGGGGGSHMVRHGEGGLPYMVTAFFKRSIYEFNLKNIQ